MADEVVKDTTTVVPDGTQNVTNPVSLKDDDLIEIQVGGETVKKPWKEAKNGFMMHEDYTRKTQGVSKQAKELKDLYDGLTTREKQIKEKEEAIDRILGRQTQTKPEDKPSFADDDVLTGAQIKDLLKTQAESLEAKFKTTLDSKSQESQQAAQFVRWEEKVGEITDNLVKEYPTLKRIPHLDKVLKAAAAESNPQGEKEMFRALAEAGKRIADDIKKDYDDLRKQEVTRKKELVSKGPDRSTGSTFATPQKDYMKDNGRKVDWNAIERDIVALDLEEND